LTDLWQALEGTRQETKFVACLYCGARDGVLLRHHCKDELELYCDWCERWTGYRITEAQVRAWVEPATNRGRRPAPQEAPLGVQVSRSCPVLNRP
jgi:hypothetical protein